MASILCIDDDPRVLDLYKALLGAKGYSGADAGASEATVVMCSGFPDDIPESLKWFADVVLEKGDGPHTLLSAIDKLIGSETKKACA